MWSSVRYSSIKNTFRITIYDIYSRSFLKDPAINYSGRIAEVFQFYSAVTGSITEETLLTEFAGKPPCFACSRTISSFGAL